MNTTSKAYNCAFKQDKAWWCRRKDQKSSSKQVISWRLGWSSAVLRALGDSKEELRCFLKRIDGGEAWERGKTRGEKDACLPEREYETKVIDFRHAAWLLGWLEGYSEKGDIRKRTDGSRVGSTAGKFYMCLLVKKGWMENPKVKELLCIDPRNE